MFFCRVVVLAAVAGTFSVLLTSAPLFAAEQELEPIVVTATRTAQTADETLASVTVITREDIERSQARSMREILRGTAGLSVANSGGPGKATTLFLRGTESDHVLVLVDGVKVGSVTLGTVAFQDMPVDQIDRIEIVRGPRSSLYGSEAIGGVIQIFTRKGQKGFRPHFSVGAGSHQTVRTSGGVSGGDGQLSYSLNASFLDTNGFNACDGQPFLSGCFTFEPDEDGTTNASGSGRIGYRFADWLEVEAHALRAQGETEFDGSFQNNTDFVQQVLGGKLRIDPTEFWRATIAAGRNEDKSDNFLGDAFASTFDSLRDTLSLQNDLTLHPDHVVTLGADYQVDSVDSETAFVEEERENFGFFAQYRGAMDRHDLLLSIRNDDNEQFGTETTGNLAYGFEVWDGLRLTASYGTGFKAPTFNELYFPGFGNPDLGPETSESVEVGVSGRFDWATWSVNLFQTEVDDLISFDPITFTPVNIAESRIRGLEAIVATEVFGVDVNASFTLLDPENREDGANRGNLLPRRAEQAFQLDLDRDFGDWRVGGTLFAEGRRFDDLANTRRLSGYATLDLRAEYDVTERWSVQGRIGNLLDKDYQTAEFFNQEGRTFFVTLRYRPGD